MAVILKLHKVDADLMRRVLMALVARPDACDAVLHGAGVERAIHKDAVKTVVRIANYIETVEKAG